MKTKIIIIGSGAAGLMAAKELSTNGFEVSILEANTQPGGRIATLTDPAFDSVIETGAEFVHGKLPLTLQLLKDAKIPTQPIKGEMFYVKNSKWQSVEEPIPHWDTLLRKMKEVETDIPIADFLKEELADEKYELLRNNVKRYAEGFDLADIHTASTIALRDEWSHEEQEQYRIEGSYQRLITYLADECIKKGVAIHTSCRATTIEWKQDVATVYTDNGKIFRSNKVLITVPVSILAKEDEDKDGIRFVPAINEQKTAAAQIGYGTVIKIFLQFETAFWKEKEKQGAFFVSDQVIPTWWTQASDESCMLTGWLGGPNAKALMKAEESIVVNLALTSLASIFSIGIETLKAQLKASKIIDWSQAPHSLGGYSFATVQTAGAKTLLRKDIQQTLFFAGEGIYEGDSPGTVEAALVSGKDAADSIIASIVKS